MDEEGNITLKIGDKIYGEAEEEDIDKDIQNPTDTAPTLIATTNTINAEFKQIDSGSSIDDSTKQYSIKKTSDTVWGEWISNTSNNHNFTGLLMDTSYDVKTRAKDSLGNGPQESKVVTMKTVSIPKPTITVTPKNMIYGEVTATIIYPSIVGCKYQYQCNGTSWIDTANTTATVKVTNNCTIYARILDNANQTGGNATYSVSNIYPISVVANQDTEYFNNNKKAIVPKEFKISDKSGESNIDTGLVVIAPDESEFVWIPISQTTLNTLVNSTYMRSNLTDWSKNGSLVGTSIPYSTTGYKEPDVVANYDSNSTNLNKMNTILGTSFIPNGTGNGSFKEYMQKEYNDIYASIKTNGGFYVGRYETGDLSKTNVVSKKGNTDIWNSASTLWYGMYAKQKKYASTLTGTNIKSNMIYGFEWDAIMKWFTTSSNSIVKNYPVNAPTTHDNFSGVKANTGTKLPVNNIYDMAGNAIEWTAEANYYGGRSIRGTYYGNDASFYYAGARYYSDPSRNDGHYGFRLALYL